VGGVPVYNVSLALLHRSFPQAPPFRVVELRPGGLQEPRGDEQIERRVERQPDRRAEPQPGRRAASDVSS
jgi:hypothetical protein